MGLSVSVNSEANLIETIVDELFNDFVDSVDIVQTIMSLSNLAENEGPNECPTLSTDSDDMAYYEAQTSSTPPVVSSNTLPQTQVKGTDPFSPDFHNRDKTGTDFHQTDCEVLNDNETNYSPKINESDYVMVCQVSPTLISPTDLKDWSGGYPSTDYSAFDYHCIESKYDIGLDSWTPKSETKNKCNAKSYLSRQSVLNQFDPLITSEDKDESCNENILSIESETTVDTWNDSTGLINQFQKFKIDGTPKKIDSNRFSPKSDLLAVVMEEQYISNESIEKFDKELKEKDETIDELKQQLKYCKERESYLKLQYSMSTIREQQLEKELKEKIESQLVLIKEKEDLEQELLTYKVQYKRVKMEINAVKSHLEESVNQIKESTGESEGVEEFITKMPK